MSESSSSDVPPPGRLDEALVEQAFLILLGLMQAGEVLGSMLLAVILAARACRRADRGSTSGSVRVSPRPRGVVMMILRAADDFVARDRLVGALAA